MSLLSNVTDKNGKKLSEKQSKVRTSNKQLTTIDKFTQEVKENFLELTKKYGVKISGNITHCKESSDSNIVEAYKIVSEVRPKGNLHRSKQSVDVPYFVVYEPTLFIEHTNITEEYTEIKKDGSKIKHNAKETLKAITK
tara:strand:+ start:194 stop:610 length:417 start_codon:yes stop_codon:yes gene_type:complete